MVQPNTVCALKNQIKDCLRKDQYRLTTELNRIQKHRQTTSDSEEPKGLVELKQRIAKSIDSRIKRLQSVPRIQFPDTGYPLDVSRFNI